MGLLLSMVAFGFGAWMTWNGIIDFSIIAEHPEAGYTDRPASVTYECVIRTVPPLTCAAISMLCAVIGLPSPVRWHSRLALIQFAISSLAVILLLFWYWAEWGPVYCVTPVLR